MTRSELFLKSFSAIEKLLHSKTNADRTVPFYQVVERAAGSISAVRRLRDDLKEFADLRNAIVHERTDGHPIAEPNERATRDIQRLESLLLAPPRVLPTFQVSVKSIDAARPIAEAVVLMRRHVFSQLPVTKSGCFAGLLTANTVARWLGGKAKDEIVSLSDTTVGEVLGHTEDPGNYVFLSRESTLFDVLDQFGNFETNGKRLEAALLTHNGMPGETFLGIITLYDLPKVLKKAAVGSHL